MIHDTAKFPTTPSPWHMLNRHCPVCCVSVFGNGGAFASETPFQFSQVCTWTTYPILHYFCTVQLSTAFNTRLFPWRDNFSFKSVDKFCLAWGSFLGLVEWHHGPAMWSTKNWGEGGGGWTLPGQASLQPYTSTLCSVNIHAPLGFFNSGSQCLRSTYLAQHQAIEVYML